LIAIADKTHHSNKTGTTLLQHLLSLFLNGSLLTLAWQIFRDNYLMALHKEYLLHSQKLRPLGIGTALRRLFNRHITKVFSSVFASHFLSFQCAIGVKGGRDLLILTYLSLITSLYQNETQPWQSLKALIGLDFTNMFNSISGKIIREELSIFFQSHYFYTTIYTHQKRMQSGSKNQTVLMITYFRKMASQKVIH
jgi:hypothetical protein